MEEILKTTLLEYEKSAFLIDLVEHKSGKQYIRILQTIQDEESEHTRAIKINPSLLSDIVKVLNAYREIIPDIEDSKPLIEREKAVKTQSRSLTESEKTAIQDRYLKGVPITDLTVQFYCTKELIEQILRNNGIAIVDNRLSKKFYFKKRRR